MGAAPTVGLVPVSRWPDPRPPRRGGGQGGGQTTLLRRVRLPEEGRRHAGQREPPQRLSQASVSVVAPPPAQAPILDLSLSGVGVLPSQVSPREPGQGSWTVTTRAQGPPASVRLNTAPSRAVCLRAPGQSQPSTALRSR